jgi:hypothetical protein
MWQTITTITDLAGLMFGPLNLRTETNMPKVKPRQSLRGHENTAQAQRDLMHATHVALQWLPQRWPAAFSDETKLIHLLAVAVRDQVLEATKAEPDAPNAKIVLRALGIWSKSRPYVRALAQSRENINLDGSVASLVADTRRANTA